MLPSTSAPCKLKAPAVNVAVPVIFPPANSFNIPSLQQHSSHLGLQSSFLHSLPSRHLNACLTAWKRVTGGVVPGTLPASAWKAIAFRLHNDAKSTLGIVVIRSNIKVRSPSKTSAGKPAKTATIA